MLSPSKTARESDMVSAKLQEAVINQYLQSSDFNGLTIEAALRDFEVRDITDLITIGTIEVVGPEDFLNPHIRPWATRRPRDEQARMVAEWAGSTVLCLYPTSLALETVEASRAWPNEPFRSRLALGAGTLDLAYFETDVIEQYRNDPRYHFWISDFEVHFGIGDDAYLDQEQRQRDKIPSLRVGFAYDGSSIRSAHVRRFACAFLGDLRRLTPEHQQRWNTYEIAKEEDIAPHPVWWSMQMGNWSDAIGPFARVRYEIEAINEVFQLITGEGLFREQEAPREWGWLLRASTQEWHSFLLMTDKLISERIRHDALTAAGVNRQTDEGTDAGSLTRLGWYLTGATPLQPQQVTAMLKPLHGLRKMRQKPAHKVVDPIHDSDLVATQRDLMSALGNALFSLREVLAHHPRARGWAPSDALTGTNYLL